MSIIYRWVKVLQNGTGPKLIELTPQEQTTLEAQIEIKDPELKLYDFYTAKEKLPPEIETLSCAQGISSNDNSIILDKEGHLLYLRLIPDKKTDNYTHPSETVICRTIQKLEIPLLKLKADPV
jgi:hypothetical protein